MIFAKVFLFSQTYNVKCIGAGRQKSGVGS
jgi:hypothetical protein